MMTGSINDKLEPLLTLQIIKTSGETYEFEATVDTGYNGFLTLPVIIIEALGLRWVTRSEGQLADGSLTTFDVYEASILWHGIPTRIEIEAAEAQPLVGMELLLGSELRIEVKVGGPMTITQSP